jgi:hypothetical protein
MRPVCQLKAPRLRSRHHNTVRPVHNESRFSHVTTAPHHMIHPQQSRSAHATPTSHRATHPQQEPLRREPPQASWVMSATTHAMLSGPPDSLARAMSRLTTSSADDPGSASTALMAGTGTTEVRPSEQRRYRSPGRAWRSERSGVCGSEIPSPPAALPDLRGREAAGNAADGRVPPRG